MYILPTECHSGMQSILCRQHSTHSCSNATELAKLPTPNPIAASCSVGGNMYLQQAPYVRMYKSRSVAGGSGPPTRD